jgi:hypothetical protein
MINLTAYCVAEFDHTIETDVSLVLVRTGPSYPHAHRHSLLLVELFIGTFTLFPRELFGLAALT